MESGSHIKRQPDGESVQFGSWQRQVLALVVTALPLCGLALALFVPPTAPVFELVFPVSILGAVVLLVLYLVGAARSEPMHPPSV